MAILMRRVSSFTAKQQPVTEAELKDFRLKESLRKTPLDTLFPKQNDFVEDKSRFMVAQCSRRAGKSNGLALRFFRTLETHPGAVCIYLALTRESAKNIMWPVLQELNEKHNLGYTFIDSKLEMKHPTNKAKLNLYGADMKNFIKRLKGQKSPGIAIDEAQDFGVHLQDLVDNILTPMLVDYEDSWLAITGTPGPVPQGYFFDITEGRKYGFSYHSWTLFENIYLHDPKGFLDDLKKKREWDDNHPTLQREWLNQWVLDVQSLWIQYNSGTADYKELPASLPTGWIYLLGIDLGYKDADALAVLGWHESSPDTYLIEELVTKGQDITGLVEQITMLDTKYHFSKMVIDQGGLGLKAAEEIRRRHHIPVIGAEKQQKQQTVAFLNDSLRLGRFRAKQDSRFAKDSYLIQIDWDKSTPDRIVIKKQPHSDIIDAVIYAFKESPAFTYQKPITKPKKFTKEYYDKVAEQLEEQAEEYFENLEKMEWWEKP